MLRLTEYMRDSIAQKPIRSFGGSILIWNLTNQCNLFCEHCYASADLHQKDEISLSKIRELIPQLHEAGVRFAILSGGEPLIRKDIYEISDGLRRVGMKTYLSSNGLLIREHNVEQIRDSFDYVGISIDGTPEIHDQFRVKKGAFQRSLQAIKDCLAVGIRVGVRFTLTRLTQSSLPFLFDLVEKHNIPKIYISHLVYSGRAQSEADLSQSEYEHAMDLILDHAFAWVEQGIERDIVTGNNEADVAYLLARFAQRHPESLEALRSRLLRWGGNQAGVRLVNIDAKGFVRPDPFFREAMGNIHERSFLEIWEGHEESPAWLQGLREKPRKIHGKCADCQFLPMCNGNSRARSMAVSGHYFMEDPACYV